MEHDPINDQTIINTNKYKIELSKNDVNIWITITLVKRIDDENDSEINSSYKIKISDFTLIDSYFNSFKGNIVLIYKYLIRIFNKNLYLIEKDKSNNEKLIIKIDCLKENKKENIVIKLDSLDKIKKDEENEQENINMEEEEESEENNISIKNCLAAPLVGEDKKIENPNDNEIAFYYKNKEKNKFIEYNLYIYKNEIKEHNYKEIIFKIIENRNPGIDEYYAHLNLVDFFHMSEFYFSQFNYSIEEIYDELLIIFSNHNYKIEKSKNFLKIAITILNTIGNQKSFIAKVYIISIKKDLVIRNIDGILTDYYLQLIKYIKKFGDDIKEEKFKDLIKDSDKYIKERINKNKERRKNEIKNLVNSIIEEFEKKNNTKKKDNKIDIDVNSVNKIYNKDINIINNNNIIISNKEIFDLYIKESKLYINKDKEKNNIKEKNENKIIQNKKIKKSNDLMKLDFNDEDLKQDNIKIVIDKIEIENIMKKLNNDSININNAGNNIININENDEKKNYEKEKKNTQIYKIKKSKKRQNNKDIKDFNEQEKEKEGENKMIEEKLIEKEKEMIIENNEQKEKKENDKEKENNEEKKKENVIEKHKEIDIVKEKEKEEQKQKIIEVDEQNQVNMEKERQKQVNIEKDKEKKMSKDKNNKNFESIKCNDENKSLNSIKENSEKSLENLNPFFLTKKRKRNLLINEKKNVNINDSLELFMNAIISRRKRFDSNKTILSDYQLHFLLRKIEKTIPQFRYINLQIHIDIIFNYNGKNNISDNDSNIIHEFYQKSKNQKNLIFLIRTENNKTFGGFTEAGFNQDNNLNNNINNYFVFSMDKMKIYDYVQNDEKCILVSENKLPEFKNQILFEENNLKLGYTGNKKNGFLVEEDYELNDGNKMFYINQIQVISLNGFNF